MKKLMLTALLCATVSSAWGASNSDQIVKLQVRVKLLENEVLRVDRAVNTLSHFLEKKFSDLTPYLEKRYEEEHKLMSSF